VERLSAKLLKNKKLAAKKPDWCRAIFLYFSDFRTCPNAIKLTQLKKGTKPDQLRAITVRKGETTNQLTPKISSPI
jgi:hypothetical protein